MSIHLSHSDVRAFVKALRSPTEGAVKHSEIIEDIAGSLGLKPDAMMHFLKTAEKHHARSPAAEDGTPPEGTLRITEHFTETLSRRLSKRLEGRTAPVSPWLVLFILAQTLRRSPDDVMRALKGDTDTRPPKRLVYDEFHRFGAGTQDPIEVFKEMFPVFYVREDSLKAIGTPPDAKSLTYIGNGWYRGER
jgi:hypothetical protein